MKRNVRIFAVVLCAALLLPGCRKTTNCLAAAPSGTAPSSGQAVSSQADSSEAADSETAQSAAEPYVQGGTVSQGGIVKTIRTENTKFNEKFMKNPIDVKYAAEMKKVFSNLDMAKVSDQYAGIWEKEIVHAYAALKKCLSSDSAKWQQIEADQKAWESGKDAALKKIGDNAAAMGGSMARLQASSGAMDFYRDRAAQLYLKLYECNKNYTYAAS